MSRVSLTVVETLELISEIIHQGNVTAGLSVLDQLIEEARRPPELEWGEHHPFNTDIRPERR